MIEWFVRFNWIIMIFFIGFLFVKYRNNFYLWEYLFKNKNSFRLLKLKEEYFSFLFKIIRLPFFIIYFVFPRIILILIDVVVKIFQNTINLIVRVIKSIKKIIINPIIKTIITIGNIFQKQEIVAIIFFIAIFYWWLGYDIKMNIVFCIILLLLLYVVIGFYNDKKSIIILFVMTTSGINLFNWFQQFSLSLPILFSSFCFFIYTLYILKVAIVIKMSKTNSLLLFLIFISLVLLLMPGFIVTSKNNSVIRITSGSLKNKDIKNESNEDINIELFLEDKKISFPVIKKDDRYYIKNNTFFKKQNEIRILVNKDDNVFLFVDNKNLSKKGKIILINNENSIIIRNGIKEKSIKITGKVIIFEKDNSYIFLDNSLGWSLLSGDKEIYIEESDARYNMLNLILFLLSIIYFWFKLYGKKNKDYYDYITILKLKETKIFFDLSKYDKFITLSMFGLTVPNIWKIVSIKNIGEMKQQLSFLSNYFWFPIIFGIFLFCMITSKEISEYVNEIGNKKPKEKKKNWQTNLCKKKGE